MRTIGAERPDTEIAVILGVDTHLNFHVAVAVDYLGRRLGESSVPTTVKGYQRLLRWAEDFGPLRCAGVEGTSSYGAGLALDPRHFLVALPERKVALAWGKVDGPTFREKVRLQRKYCILLPELFDQPLEVWVSTVCQKLLDAVCRIEIILLPSVGLTLSVTHLSNEHILSSMVVPFITDAEPRHPSISSKMGDVEGASAYS